MLQSAVNSSKRKMRRSFIVFSRLNSVLLLTVLSLTFSLSVSAQETPKQEDTKKEEPKKENEKPPVQQIPDISKNLTAEGVAETAIVIYGGYGGRNILNQIRKTTLERGKMIITNDDGTTDNATYQRWIVRNENLDKEKHRFEQEFANSKYSLIYDGEKTFGIINNTVFSPQESAINSFQHQIWHGLEALLRYKENGSKLDLIGKDKIMNVDLYKLDVTDKQNRKTRFYLSVKTLRVMMLEYEEDGVKYKRKFYNYNYSQGTLVPYQSILWANDKQVEETNIMTITFGQKVEDLLFAGTTAN